MKIEIPYYEDKTRISNSNIGWFLNKGPAYLHKMLTEDVPEEKNSTLERGTMIHEYLLQPEEFQKDYIVWDKSRPSSSQQEAFCQALVNSIEIEPNKAVLSAYKQSYSTTGKTDDKMLSEGLKIASTLKDYIDFLKQKDNRKMITFYDYQMLEKIKHNVQSHRLAKSLLKKEGKTDTGDVYHEFHINWDTYTEYDFIRCKSLLDSIEFNYEKKKCIIVDLKTTSKLWNFEESMESFSYGRQLQFYKRAAMWYIKHIMGDYDSEWTFDLYIIAIDTQSSNEVRVFRITDDWLVYDDVIDYALDEISWHFKNDLWDHSSEYYTGNGSETLKK